MRYLALGDSYTIGEAVPQASCWPRQLAAALRIHGFPLRDPEIVARTGWITDELAAGIDAAHPKGAYALVTLQIGVNNQYRGAPLEEYRTQFRALLLRAIAFAQGSADRVLVVSIPDWGVAAFAEGRDRADIARQLDAFNRVASQEAAKVHAHWADVTGISRSLGAQPQALAPDGLHPSGLAYSAWLKTIEPAARGMLAPR